MLFSRHLVASPDRESPFKQALKRGTTGMVAPRQMLENGCVSMQKSTSAEAASVRRMLP
ncbi:hypothetical protein R69888_01495 [Paraburkholderia haematera]|uniref:Uncharacterized protein n=1 Tax=Paraburkholderia haematera TaxID=2793077 RepID=A0ABN7KXE8_9BURK|nr:hypothetical protein R69888_01495 [Paraburkholderia haematera]